MRHVIIIAILTVTVGTVIVLNNMLRPHVSAPQISTIERITDTDEIEKRKKIIFDWQEKAKKIKNFSADIDVVVSRFKKLQAKLHCQRPRYCRLIMTSEFGKEVDIGSNEKYFWYWFKRQEPTIIFYSTYEKGIVGDLPINPIWISECFNMRLLPDNYTIFNINYGHKQYLSAAVKYGDLLKITSFDEKKAILNVIYDEKSTIASCAKNNFNKDDLPTFMIISIPEEGIYMHWTITNYKINHTIPKETWEIPSQKGTEKKLIM